MTHKSWTNETTTHVFSQFLSSFCIVFITLIVCCINANELEFYNYRWWLDSCATDKQMQLKKEKKKKGYDNKTKSDPCPSKQKKIKASETCKGEFCTCTKCGLLFSFQNLSLASLSWKTNNLLLFFLHSFLLELFIFTWLALFYFHQHGRAYLSCK